jgi:hypothetical protein
LQYPQYQELVFCADVEGIKDIEEGGSPISSGICLSSLFVVVYLSNINHQINNQNKMDNMPEPKRGQLKLVAKS